jgi:hypothetical protein
LCSQGSRYAECFVGSEWGRRATRYSLSLSSVVDTFKREPTVASR